MRVPQRNGASGTCKKGIDALMCALVSMEWWQALRDAQTDSKRPCEYDQRLDDSKTATRCFAQTQSCVPQRAGATCNTGRSLLRPAFRVA